MATSFISLVIFSTWCNVVKCKVGTANVCLTRLGVQLHLFIYFAMTAACTRETIMPFPRREGVGGGGTQPLCFPFVCSLRHPSFHYYNSRGGGGGGKEMESHCVNTFWNISHGTHLNHPKWSIQWSVTVQRRLTQTASAWPLSLGNY